MALQDVVLLLALVSVCSAIDCYVCTKDTNETQGTGAACTQNKENLITCPAGDKPEHDVCVKIYGNIRVGDDGNFNPYTFRSCYTIAVPVPGITGLNLQTQKVDAIGVKCKHGEQQELSDDGNKYQFQGSLCYCQHNQCNSGVRYAVGVVTGLAALLCTLVQ